MVFKLVMNYITNMLTQKPTLLNHCEIHFNQLIKIIFVKIKHSERDFIM